MALITEYEYVTAKRRREKLVNRLLAIILAIAVVYWVIYLFYDSKAISVPLLAPFFALPIFLYILNRFWKSDLHISVGLFGFDVALFMVASSESPSTGVYLHFISACAASIALFSYEKRWKSLIFISISVFLFLLVNLVTIHLICLKNPPALQVVMF